MVTIGPDLPPSHPSNPLNTLNIFASAESILQRYLLIKDDYDDDDDGDDDDGEYDDPQTPSKP